MLNKKFLSVKLCGCTAALICMALGATAAQSNIYEKYNPALVMGGKGSILYLKPGKANTIPSIPGNNVAGTEYEIMPPFSIYEVIKGVTYDNPAWLTARLHYNQNGHDSIAVMITADPDTVDRTGYILLENRYPRNSQTGTTYFDTIHVIQPGTRCIDPKQDNMGRDFFVAFMENDESGWNTQVELYLYATSDDNTTVSVFNNANNTLAIPNTVPLDQNQVKVIYSAIASGTGIRSTPAYNYTGESQAVRSFHVTSGEPISLYAYNAQSATSEIACVIPTPALGDEYFAVSYSSQSDRPEEFMIIATEDITLVTITLPDVTENGTIANDPFTITLRKGETYLVKSRYVDFADPGLTGTHIKASKPIAVFSGHKRARVPKDCPNGGTTRDHLFEQLLPLRSWGKRYALVNSHMPSNTYRIVAAYDNTTITIKDSRGTIETTTIDRGKYIERRIIGRTSEYAYVEADQPIEVMLFGETFNCMETPRPQSGQGDPFSIALGPSDRGLFNATFSPVKLINTQGTNPGEHYTTVITETLYKDQTTLTRTNRGYSPTHLENLLDFKDMPNTPYSYATFDVQYDIDYNYQLSNPYGFTAYAYGYANVEAYGYLLGAQLGEKVVETGIGTAGNLTYCVGDVPPGLPACLNGSTDITQCPDADKRYYWYDNLDAWNNNDTLLAPPTFSTERDTTYTFFVSQMGRCGVLYPQQVTVEVKPIPSFTFSNHEVCLSAPEGTSYGGIPPAGATGKYTFTDGSKRGQPFNHREAGEGTYNVTYTCSYDYGCPVSVPATVEVMTHHPTIEVEGGGYASICHGEELKLLRHQQLGISISHTQWYRNDSLISGEIGDMLTITPLQDSFFYASGVYSARVRDYRGCVTTVDTAVTISQRPGKPIVVTSPRGKPKAICPGGSVTLLDSLADKSLPGDYYHWYRTNEVSEDTRIQGITSSRYTVVDENNGSNDYLFFILGSARPIKDHPTGKACWMYDTVSIMVNSRPDKPVIMADNDPRFCEDDSVMIRVIPSTAKSHRWMLDVGGSRTQLSDTSSQIYAKVAGTYQVWGRSPGGCESLDFDKVSVTGHIRPTVPTIEGDVAVCPSGSGGKPAVLKAVSSGSSYQWYFATGSGHIKANGETGEEYSTGSSGDYAVLAYSDYVNAKGTTLKCPSVDTSAVRHVTVQAALPPPTISAEDFVCANTQHTLTASSSSPDIKAYRWYKNGDITGVIDSTYTETFAYDEDSASYRVYVIGYDQECQSPDSDTKLVKKQKANVSIAAASNKTEICFGDQVTLQTTSRENVGASGKYQWYNGPNDSDTIPGAKQYSYTVQGSGTNAGETKGYRVRVVDSHGCKLSPSNTVYVSIYEVPATPVVTTASPVCEHSSLTLTASPSNIGTYQWSFFPEGGETFEDFGVASTDTSYLIGSAITENMGTYKVKVTNTYGCSSEAQKPIEVLKAPAKPNIDYDLLRVCSGNSIKLKAYDLDGFKYTKFEWYFNDGNGKKLLPADSVDFIYAKQAGPYSVKGVNRERCWSLESEQTTMVILRKPERPSISSPSGSLSGDSIGICSNIPLILVGSSAGATSYQWYMANDPNNPDKYDISDGKIGSRNTITGPGRYAVRARVRHSDTEECESDLMSVPIKVTLHPVPSSPKVTDGRVGIYSFEACAGDTVPLVADCYTEGATIASYTWYKNGFVMSELTKFCNVFQVENAKYQVKVISDKGCETAMSDSATVNIRRPTVEIIGGAKSICHGDDASVVLETIGNTTAGSKYRWYKNKTIIQGDTVASYEVKSEGDKSQEQVASYYVEIVDDELGCRSEKPSNPVTVSIHALPPPPRVPTPTPVCANTNILLTAQPQNAGSYKWFINNMGVFDSVAATPIGSYLIAKAQPSNAGEYRVEVSNTWGCKSSSEVWVAVNPLPQKPTIMPHDVQRICTGDTVLLKASKASPSDTCKWYFSDGSSNVYRVSGSDFIARMAGTYSTRSVSEYGCISEDIDAVGVEIYRRPDVPIITPEGDDISVCDNENTTIRGPVAGATSYQWFRANSAGKYTTINMATDDSCKVHETGSYVLHAYIQYENATCSSISAPKRMEILPVFQPPTVAGVKTATGEKTSGCDGETIALIASPVNNSVPVSYRWYKNNTEMTFITTDTCLITQVEAAEYKAAAVSDKGCSSPASAPREVVIRPLPTVSIVNGPRESCGDNVTISAISSAIGSRYEWYEDGVEQPDASTSSFYVVQGNADATIGKKASYYLFVTDGYGCRSASASNPVEVNIRALPPNPTIAIAPDGGVCEGSNATMTVSPPNAGNYTWYKMGNRTFDSIYFTSANTYRVMGTQISDAGQYAVEVTNIWGCKSASRGEATLDVKGLPRVYFTATRACESWDKFNYVEPAGGWFSGWGTKDSMFIPSDVHQGTAVVTYTYTAPNGCSNSDTKDIEIVRLPNIPTIAADGMADNEVKVCPGDIAVTLQTRVAAISDGEYSTNYSYQWDMNGFPIPGETALNYVATKQGFYTVRICNQGLCWAASPSEAVTVSQIPTPTAPFIAASPSLTFCPGDSVVLSVQSNDQGIFRWHKGDGRQMDVLAGEIADAYLAREAGQYAVDYVGESGCRSALSNALTITEHPMPKQPEIIPSQANLYSGLDYKLLVKYPEAGEQYGWYKNTLYADVTNAAFPIKNLSGIDTGSYTVKATNLQGCFVWSDSYPLRLTKAELFVPNIFTPNGDGINDYFQIIGLDDYAENKLEILNKHGRVIFSQKNYHNTWDGKGFPNDIYYYTLELKRGDGSASTQHGYVHLKQ